MIPLVKFSPENQWDQTMLTDAFEGRLWHVPNAYEFEYFEEFPRNIEGAVVLIAGRYYVDQADYLNEQLQALKWALVILCSDEESLFPWEKLQHPNMKLWVMTPRPKIHKKLDYVKFIGEGYSPHIKFWLENSAPPVKDIDWAFAGQVTHERRTEMCRTVIRWQIDHRGEYSNGKLIETESFNDGLPYEQYFDLMSKTKVALCPSGPATPDSFRFFEALECGCIPIAESTSPKGADVQNYWEFLYPDAPFPILTKSEQWPGFIKDAVDNYPANANKIFAWWIAKKREFAYNLNDDLEELINALSR